MKATSEEKNVSTADQTLRNLIEKFTRYSTNDAVLAFDEDGKRRMPYKELTNLVRRLSNGLRKAGLEKGDTVLLMAPNSSEFVVAALSVINAGGVSVPVDLQSNDEVLRHIIKDSDAATVFTDAKGIEKLHRLKLDKKLSVYRLDEESEPNSWKHLLSDTKGKEPELTPEDPAVIFYTSGTTGMPKGVPLTHLNICTQIEAVKNVKLLRPDDRTLLPLPLFHVYPFVVGMLSPLALGLTIVLPKSVTGPEITRALKDGKVTVLFAVPRLLRALYSAIEAKYREHKFSSTIFDAGRALSNLIYLTARVYAGKSLFGPVHQKFPNLRLIACGGALLDPELAKNYRALGWQIAIGYGLTETSPLLTIRMPNNLDLESVGKAVPGVELRMGEIQETDEAEQEVAGDKAKKKAVAKPATAKKDEPEKRIEKQTEKQTEIQARGNNIFTGYRNLPEKTEETFTEDGWFKTGDIGEMKNGNLHITGRISIMIKSEGGKKIQPDEVEEAYAKDPLIREIGVLQVDQKLVALIVPDLKMAGQGDLNKKISESLNKRSSELESYLRVNDFAITREPLPRTNLGKVKRKELIERYEKAKAEGSKGKELKKGKQSPSDMSPEDRSLLEEPIAEDCWEWLGAKFPDAALSMDSSPQVDLNVDSLEWLNLTLEIRERLGVDLNEEAIARIDTVRDLLKEVLDASKLGVDKTSPLEHPEKIIAPEQKKWLQPLGPVMSFLSVILYWKTRILMRVMFRASPEGLDNLANTQYVFTPNHASYLDAFALASVLPYERLKKTQWAGWAGIALANPFNAFIYRLAQAIPIEAKKSLVSSLALGAAVLKKHRSLVWFPEGERTLDGKLLPFKSGIGMLLQNSEISVVPVYIDGTREALPPGAFFPKFAKVTVKFGDPVLPEELKQEGKGNTDPEKIANAIQARVQKLSKRKIQKAE